MGMSCRTKVLKGVWGNENSQISPTLDSYELRWYFWVANENARYQERDDSRLPDDYDLSVGRVMR